MHLACRYGSSHRSIKLVCCTQRAAATASWQISQQTRSLFSTSSAIRQLDLHGLGRDPENRLGSYAPNANPNPRAKNIAVLGGGISGLATAFNLTKDIPNAKITIFDAQNELGGWVDSEQVEVDDGSILLEWGPRTLRPDLGGSGIATIQLINRLKVSAEDDLSKHIRGVQHGHPASTNRYIYYPDHLVRMPAPNPNSGMISNLFNLVRSVVSEPIFKGVVGSFIAEPSVACRPLTARDESLGSFITRRYGSALADNLLSALIHGIYAGDIYKLSARTLFPAVWYLENRDQDGNGINTELMELFFRQHTLRPFSKVRFINRLGKDNVGEDKAFSFLCSQMRHTSAYSFVKGIGQLTDALLSNLSSNPNVTIQSGTKVDRLEYDSSNHKFSISSSGSETKLSDFDYAVSSLSPETLANVLKPQPRNAETQSESQPYKSVIYSLTRGKPPAVNVMVVNLYYRSPILPIPPGFGYLIPRSVPIDQNPERALGVIFASETAGPRGPENAFKTITKPNPEKEKELEAIMKDRPADLTNEKLDKLVFERWSTGTQERIQVGQDTASGTKLAVMLGGHWWEGWTESDLPSEEDAIKMAKQVIQRHLRIDEQPILAKARLQRQCIPQYQVGYRDDMARVHKDVLKTFDGRLKLLGPWWQGGVGVNDCIMAARETSRRIREAWDDETGLESFTENEKWVIVDRRTRVEVMDPLQK